MSVLDQEEFVELRKFRSKVDTREVEAILSELEIEARKNVIKTALIFVYANHVEAVTRNRAFYNLVGAILEKYSPKIGVEGVKELILNSLS
ncbi:MULTISPECIES: hypothetical protein [Metallosphaera]|uniref:Calcium binding protein SSO6904 domain-containing protein n=3 Tax=Metallosphaera TaxID=41980 RepID=A4YHL7_METS5|nr:MULTISPECIES: hypothetical protein [Metallosphaera]ABP95919.1 hypothetical protein Msed_1764 [Metallosphaera sedula DSM 5348]AIM27903.1 hypothetical protein HA72_1764 [Metallosphaera sedula]AKV74740.1 hypothetical protein MsedA_1799 [Metallosphaera sedula]AKV76977.1 hypothetical protein MsedB_1801 [Metallosphaera sedula]AKV79228.1 hypothetical protein MsedC_1799 [Metallosphaera sedula]